MVFDIRIFTLDGLVGSQTLKFRGARTELDTGLRHGSIGSRDPCGSLDNPVFTYTFLLNS